MSVLPRPHCASPECRDVHRRCSATGKDYEVEATVGCGLVAPNGDKINAEALGENAPSYCCPSSKTLKPACGIKQR